jgi:hypothetical protein
LSYCPLAQSTESLSATYPGDELDKVVVEGDTGLGVKDGRLGGSDEVGRDNLVLGVTEDTLELLGLGSLLDDGLDLVVRSTLLDSDSQVDNGDIGGGDSESHTGKFTVELGNDLSDGLGGTGGRGDDVGGSASTSSPVLYLLVCSHVSCAVNALLEGPSTVFWVAVVAWTVVMRPSTMVNWRSARFQWTIELDLRCR